MIVQFTDCSNWNVRVADILIFWTGKKKKARLHGCAKAEWRIIIQSIAGSGYSWYAAWRNNGNSRLIGRDNARRVHGMQLQSWESERERRKEREKKRDSYSARDETGNVTVCRAVFSTPWSSVCVGACACRPRRRHRFYSTLHTQPSSCSVYSSAWWDRMDLLN